MCQPVGTAPAAEVLACQRQGALLSLPLSSASCTGCLCGNERYFRHCAHPNLSGPVHIMCGLSNGSVDACRVATCRTSKTRLVD